MDATSGSINHLSPTPDAGRHLDQLINCAAFYLHSVIRARTGATVPFDQTLRSYRQELRYRVLAIANDVDVTQLAKPGDAGSPQPTTQFVERLAAWHSCTADIESDQQLRAFHRDAARVLRALHNSQQKGTTNGC